jgi:hypothetical protein
VGANNRLAGPRKYIYLKINKLLCGKSQSAKQRLIIIKLTNREVASKRTVSAASYGGKGAAAPFLLFAGFKFVFSYHL